MTDGGTNPGAFPTAAGSGGATENGGSATLGAGTGGKPADGAPGGSTSAGGMTGGAGTTSALGITGAARTIADLHYAGGTSASQSLDLLLPANARLPLPLVVRFHGGGFSGGNKSMEETGTAAKAILAQGYALASVNYRLSGEALFPAGAQDAKAAVRWLRAHAADYGLDSAHFASWGESAGGYLAVLLGVTGDQATVFDNDALGNPGVSSALAAVVDWYGPTDLGAMDSQQMPPPANCGANLLKHQPADSPEGKWLGGALDTPAVATKLMQANLPAYVATAKALPFFIEAHGDSDCQVPWGQSQELKDALAKVANIATLTILPGAGHADARFESTQSAPAVAMLASAFGR